MKYKYPFIAIEGCDGVGKTTIRGLIKQELELLGNKCMIIGQHAWMIPSISQSIINIREQRRQYSADDISDLYFIDKYLHSFYTVRENLDKCVILADRTLISDAVYHEALYSLSAEQTLIKYLESGAVLPSLCIHVTVDLQSAYERILNRSKKTRHYEKPCELQKIMHVYTKVFEHSDVLKKIPVITFTNNKINWKDNVKEFLLPELISQLESIGYKMARESI